MNGPIAICRNDDIFSHSGNWNRAFIDYCVKNGIPYELINCYDSDIISCLGKYPVMLWAIQNYVLADIMESRSILRTAQNMGLKVFPDINTCWHFDDKIAQAYVLEATGAPIPHNYVFYQIEKCIEWLKTEAVYPLIAKLRCGSGSNGVRMLKTKRQAVSYARRMFGSGYRPALSMIYKAYSKAQSSKSWAAAFSRLRRFPEFLETRKHSKRLPAEKDYCYFQEYIPNDGYDLKVAVVGDKLGFIARRTRKGGFAASGGGNLFYDRSLISEQIIKSAFETSDKLKLQCTGFDYVVNKETGVGYIIEMCYGFDWTAVEKCGGYWDRDFVWHDEPLRVPDEIISNIIKSG